MRYERSISVTSAILISKVQLRPTSSAAVQYPTKGINLLVDVVFSLILLALPYHRHDVISVHFGCDFFPSCNPCSQLCYQRLHLADYHKSVYNTYVAIAAVLVCGSCVLMLSLTVPLTYIMSTLTVSRV